MGRGSIRMGRGILKIVLFLFIAGGLLWVSPVQAANGDDGATGDVLLYVIEISDSENRFNAEMQSTVKHHIGRVEMYYEERAPAGANLDISTEIVSADTGYTGDYESDYKYRELALQDLGYSRLPSLIEDKTSDGYENVAVFFVVPVEGRSFAGDSTTTIYYYEFDNAVARLIDLDDTASVVYAHELGHIFGADDEYYEPGRMGRYGDINTLASDPMERLYPNFNYMKGPSPEESPKTYEHSIMSYYGFTDGFGWFNISTPPSVWARGMIGWRDFDLDGVLDPFDTDMSVSFPQDRQPILNAKVDQESSVRYTEFGDVVAKARYDDASLVDGFMFRLVSPRGEVVDEEVVTDGVSTGVTPSSALTTGRLVASVPDAEKPGNWSVQYFFGQSLAAWIDVEVVAPLVRLPVASIDFGRVNVEDMAEGEFVVRNEGKMRLDFGEVSVETEEEVVRGPSTRSVDAKSSETQRVTISPSEVGPITGTMVFRTNDPRNPTVSVMFDGVGFAVYRLLADAPSEATVSDEVPMTVRIVETSESLSDYVVKVTRFGREVSDAGFINVDKAVGEATIVFDKYGDYAVTIDKRDTELYEYRPDTVRITIERLMRQIPLHLQVSKQSVKTQEQVVVTPRAEGEGVVTADLYVDDEFVGTDDRFVLTFDAAGNHSLRIEKSQVTTDREIRNYIEDEVVVEVQERSVPDKIIHDSTDFFESLINRIKKILGIK